MGPVDAVCICRVLLTTCVSELIFNELAQACHERRRAPWRLGQSWVNRSATIAASRYHPRVCTVSACLQISPMGAAAIADGGRGARRDALGAGPAAAGALPDAPAAAALDEPGALSAAFAMSRMQPATAAAAPSLGWDRRGDGGTGDSASLWMVLRSIDEDEEAGLMSEGDALSFAESDAWRPVRTPIALLPRPVRRQDADSAAAVEPPCGEAEAVAQDLAAGAAESAGQVAVVPPRPMRLCNVLEVVGRALLPVQKLCDALGVDLVMLSSALMAHMDGVMGRRGPAGGRGGASGSAEPDAVLMRVADVDCAERAISHVLDSAMQRVSQHGCMLVGVERDCGNGGTPARVHVTIADTGVAAWRGAWEAGGRPAAKSAQDAIQQLERGEPVSSGEMALWIAERFVQQSGGALTVGRWSHADVEYVRAVITFRGL